MKEKEAVVKLITAFFTPKIPYFTPSHPEFIAKIRYNKKMDMLSKNQRKDSGTMKIAVCDDDRTTREQIASLIREQEPDAKVLPLNLGKK